MSAQINSHTNAQSSVSSLLSVFAFPAVIAVNIARRIQERRELNALLSMGDHALQYRVATARDRACVLPAGLEPEWRVTGETVGWC